MINIDSLKQNFLNQVPSYVMIFNQTTGAAAPSQKGNLYIFQKNIQFLLIKHTVQKHGEIGFIDHEK